ncbi:MAG: hypothetical protein QM642_05435 [Edaphocola sp.]
MKKVFLSLFAVGVVATAVTIPQKSEAQISFNLNIGGGRGWLNSGFNGNFCYLPAINCYYDVANSLYYYLSGGNWVNAPYLPDYYSGYNLAGMYQVPVYGPNPWMYNRRDYNRYRRYARMGVPRGRQPLYAGPRGGGYNRGGNWGPGNRPGGGQGMRGGGSYPAAGGPRGGQAFRGGGNGPGVNGGGNRGGGPQGNVGNGANRGGAAQGNTPNGANGSGGQGANTSNRQGGGGR